MVSTETMMVRVKRLLNYVATYSNAFLRYYANNMVLHIDSNAAYLVAPEAKSRIAGFDYLSTFPSKVATLKLRGSDRMPLPFGMSLRLSQKQKLRVSFVMLRPQYSYSEFYRLSATLSLLRQ